MQPWLRLPTQTTVLRSQIFYDFSPERSKYLKIECFQFHQGYCGCLIEDVTDQHYFEIGRAHV